jgi:hypothetical protein
VRVPGFPDSVAAPAGEPEPTLELHRRAATKPLSVRLMAPLLLRYKRLLRDLDDEGFDSTLTELVHALLHQGPRTTDEAREVVKRWRRTLDDA